MSKHIDLLKADVDPDTGRLIQERRMEIKLKDRLRISVDKSEIFNMVPGAVQPFKSESKQSYL